MENNQIVIYENPNGMNVEIKVQQESVWLPQKGIAALFGVERSVITKHINNIFKDEQVDKESNVQFLHIANSDKPVEFYSLDVILSVGYKVNSKNAIAFRKWATGVSEFFTKFFCKKNFVIAAQAAIGLGSASKASQNERLYFGFISCLTGKAAGLISA
jgi:hypothetical protein